MKITPKTPEQVEAQILAFIESEHFLPETSSPENKSCMYDRLSEIATLSAGSDVTRETSEPERSQWRNSDGRILRKLLPDVEVGSDVAVAKYDNYVDFLRKKRTTDQRNSPDLEGRVELETAYEKYKPTVDNFFEQLGQEHESIYDAPEFMGSIAFRLKVGDQELVVRKATTDKEHASIRGYVNAMIRGRKIAGLEQLRATSLKEGVVVSDHVPGSASYSLSTEEMLTISAEQVDSLVGALVDMQVAGIIPDLKGSNLLYDKENGFGIIDYARIANELIGGQTNTVAGMLLYATPLLDNLGARTIPEKQKIERPDEEQEIKRARMSVFEKYIDACRKYIESNNGMKEVIAIMESHLLALKANV